MIEVINGDISLAKADIIVNASNGDGYMGGRRCANEYRKGIAESLCFRTNGKIETETLKIARKYHCIPSFILGKQPGEIFFSNSCGLNCKKVLHAVTMRHPGSASSYNTIEKLMPLIFCFENRNSTIAIPLLGTGTGGLDKHRVYVLIEKWALIAKKFGINTKIFIYE